jgi:signal transduction histidine kinase
MEPSVGNSRNESDAGTGTLPGVGPRPILRARTDTISRRHLEELFSRQRDFAVELDLTGRCLASNLDGEPESTIQDTVPRALIDAVRERMASAVNTGEASVCDYQVRGSSSMIEVECLIEPTAPGVVSARFRDVTEQRKAERALFATLGALHQSAQVLSHELREPLLGMRRLSRWLAELVPGEVRAEAERYVNLLERRLDRLDNHMRALRRFISTGTGWGDPEPCDIVALVAEAVAAVRARNPDATFTLSTRVAVGDESITTARQALLDCLIELIDNAVHHHDGEARVEVRVGHGSGVRIIEVADDGPGIPEKFRDKIFDLFATLEAREETAGLGLAIVDRILSLCEGAISVAGRPGGRGVVFQLQWPETWPVAPHASRSRALAKGSGLRSLARISGG